MGAVVDHNKPVQNPQSGTCIFLHIWRPAQTPTGGCTAMAEQDMRAIFGWLETTKKPVLLQLPQVAYRQLQKAWKLPDMAQ